MNSKILLATALALTWNVGTQPAIAASETECNRSCLLELLNRFEARLLEHAPKGLTLTRDFRSTENYHPMALGEGYWTRVKQIFDQLQLADPISGQVAAVGLLDDGGRDAYFVLRLKVEQGRKLSQSEMLLVHDGDAMYVQKDRSLKLDRTYLQTVPEAQRSTREELQNIAAGFVDAWQYRDMDLMKFSKDCAFFENNVRLQEPGVTSCGDMVEAGGKRGIPGAGTSPLRGDANRTARPTRPADPSIGRPELQGSQPWMRDRRYPLIDTEHGVVLSYHIMGGEPAKSGEPITYERASKFTTSSLSQLRSKQNESSAPPAAPPQQNQGQSPAPGQGPGSGQGQAAPPQGPSGAAYMAGLFKIVNGEIVRMDHFEWEGGSNASGGFADGPAH